MLMLTEEDLKLTKAAKDYLQQIVYRIHRGRDKFLESREP